MIYLKTYFYTEHEVKFLIMNLIESYDFIDGFIISEHNRTHTGQPREYIWDKVKHEFPQQYMDKVIYLKSDISEETVEAYDDEESIHRVNEPVMRSSFMKDMTFDDNDIIISVDADEIINSEAYLYILTMADMKECVRLNLHQFFYKLNYLWEGKDFVSPIAAKYKVFKNDYPCNWRDVGEILPHKVGCHFSWCMSPKEMVYKLHTYSHPRYRFCADEELLSKAIEEKTYPFDNNVEFNIREIEFNDEILPSCVRSEGV
jgi:hypothetical protein